MCQILQATRKLCTYFFIVSLSFKFTLTGNKLEDFNLFSTTAFGSTILRAAGTSVAFAIRIGRREATTVPFVTAAFSNVIIIVTLLVSALAWEISEVLSSL